MDKRLISNTSQNALIRHTFHQVYSLKNTSIIYKAEPPVVRYILTTSSFLDLCLNAFRFKKHITKMAFKTNFCRELVGKCSLQTTQIVLHYSNESRNNKVKMIASLNSPLVSNFCSEQNGARNNDASIKCNQKFFNFQNKKYLKQNKKKDSAIRTRPKEAKKKAHYLEPVVNSKVFLTLTQCSKKKFEKQGPVCSYTVLKKAEKRAVSIEMRAPFSFNKLSSKEIIVKNLHKLNATQPFLYSFLPPPAFTPIFFFKDKIVNRNKKWVKASSFKDEKNLINNLLRADWLLNHFIYQFTQLEKKNPRAIMNQLINNVRILIEKTGSECPILGARMTLTGRLGNRKKGMAQQISKSVGTIPLSTLRQNVDYSQGFLGSRLGLIGVKVWVCYR